MDTEKFLKMDQNVSREELEKIQDTLHQPKKPRTADPPFEVIPSYCDSIRREIEETKGKYHVRAEPLLQVLSVRVVPDKVDEKKQPVIYGRIYVEGYGMTDRKRRSHDLYNRRCDDPETLGPSGFLTLIGPSYLCHPFLGHPCDVWIPLHKTRIVVDVWDKAHNTVFAEESFFVEETTTGDLEQVKLEVVRGKLGSLEVLYIAMLFAALPRLDVKFFHKLAFKDNNINPRVVNVNGKISARYGNTFGSYASEECTLFEKRADEFEQVVVGERETMKLSRHWMSLPAYSSLIIDLDLSDFDTKRKIIKATVELLGQDFSEYVNIVAVDDLVIQLDMTLFKPRPHGVCIEESDIEVEDKVQSYIEIEDESSNDNESSSSNVIPWALHRHKSKPEPSALVEVFSVFIGRQKSRALRIFGIIEISSGDNAFHIFAREEKDAMQLLEHDQTAPIPDGSRVFNDYKSLEMKFDLRDVEGQLSVKGYVDWGALEIDPFHTTLWCDKQICSVIPGQNGFAALHYSIFPEAVQAKIEVCYKLKKGSVDACPMVYGSVVTQYSNYDYSTRYKREYFRSVLFKRIAEDPVQLKTNGEIPLSRSIVVVPSSSSLIVEVDLWTANSNQVLSRAAKIEIGSPSMSMESEDCLVHIKLDWGECE